MKLHVVSLFVLCCVASLSPVNAQGLFSGNSENAGGTSWWNKNQDGTAKPNWFGKGLWNRDSSDYPKPEKFGDSQTGGGLFGRPSWLPERDPNEPTMFEKMSENSKSAWQNTSQSLTNWRSKTNENFRNASQNFRESTTRTWESITGGMKRNTTEDTGEPRPPLRSANNWFGGGNQLK